jgi:hypothetical protein
MGPPHPSLKANSDANCVDILRYSTEPLAHGILRNIVLLFIRGLGRLASSLVLKVVGLDRRCRSDALSARAINGTLATWVAVLFSAVVHSLPLLNVELEPRRGAASLAQPPLLPRLDGKLQKIHACIIF